MLSFPFCLLLRVALSRNSFSFLSSSLAHYHHHHHHHHHLTSLLFYIFVSNFTFFPLCCNSSFRCRSLIVARWSPKASNFSTFSCGWIAPAGRLCHTSNSCNSFWSFNIEQRSYVDDSLTTYLTIVGTICWNFSGKGWRNCRGVKWRSSCANSVWQRRAAKS